MSMGFTRIIHSSILDVERDGVMWGNCGWVDVYIIKRRANNTIDANGVN